MCSKHYIRLKRHGTTVSPFLDNWTRYMVDETGCWLWAGPIYNNGYGKLSRAAHGTRLAHRAFYMRRHGDLARSVDLDHLCRIRHCVNPDHLEPVSRSLNIKRGYNARRQRDTSFPMCNSHRQLITNSGGADGSPGNIMGTPST